MSSSGSWTSLPAWKQLLLAPDSHGGACLRHFGANRPRTRFVPGTRFSSAVRVRCARLALRARTQELRREIGLRVEELDGTAVALALEYRRARRSLSLPDSFALSLSKTNSWTLLSGDGSLRALALEDVIECHGVLWLLDHLHEHRILDQDFLTEGLRRIAEHPRCRLPQAEIRARFRTYSSL